MVQKMKASIIRFLFVCCSTTRNFCKSIPQCIINITASKCSWCAIDEGLVEESIHLPLNWSIPTNITQKSARNQKFVIFSVSRSGSTYLQSILKLHSKILIYSEIFNPRDIHTYLSLADSIPSQVFNSRQSYPKEFLDYVWSDNKRRYSTIGFKLQGGHLCLRDVVQVLIKDTPRLKKVILYRADILSTYTSFRIATTFDRWSRFNTSQYQVVVDVADFIKYKEAMISYYSTLVKEINKTFQKYILIEYNNDLRNKLKVEATLARLQRFLGVNSLKFKHIHTRRDQIKKQSRVHVSAQITNWEQLPPEIRQYANKSASFNALFLQPND